MPGLRFGTFMAPFNNPPIGNPVTGLQRDLEYVQLLDRLGFEEAWIGEHHSSGTEIIPSPELFIAWAAAQTRRIRLGTGVLSLTYHNPLWAADRLTMLSNILRDRLMIGLGPGALPIDAEMVGLDRRDLRQMFLQDVDVLMHLLTSEEPLSVETPRYKLVDAYCQLRMAGEMDMCVTSIVTHAGPMTAGKWGGNLLSVGATSEEGFAALNGTWSALEESSRQHGHVADRSKWRMACLMHVAETREQAVEDVRYNFDNWAEYTQSTIAAPFFRASGHTFEERIDWINEAKIGVVGTPDDAIELISRLEEQSGGFGAFLLIHHEWARPEATKRSLELFADRVIPHFQGLSRGRLASEALSKARWAELDARVSEGIDTFNKQHAR